MEKIQEKSLYKTDTTVTAGDQIVTLSTCDYALDPEAGRLVVHAKLVKDSKKYRIGEVVTFLLFYTLKRNMFTVLQPLAYVQLLHHSKRFYYQEYNLAFRLDGSEQL